MATSSSLLFSVTLRCPCHGRSLSRSPSAGSGASGSPRVRLRQRSGSPALWAGTSLCFPASPLTVFAKLESEWERVDQRGRGARHRGVGCCPLMPLLHPPTCGPGPSRVCTSPPHATRRRELTSPGTSVHGRFLASPGPLSPQRSTVSLFPGFFLEPWESFGSFHTRLGDKARLSCLHFASRRKCLG